MPPVSAQLDAIRAAGNVPRSATMDKTTGQQEVVIAHMKMAQALATQDTILAQQEAILAQMSQNSMGPGPMQRSPSMVRTSAQQEAALSGAATSMSIPMMSFMPSTPGPLHRAPSMVRTPAQQESALTHACKAAASLVPGSSVQVAPLQASAPGSLQRASSMIRTPAQQAAALAGNTPVPPQSSTTAPSSHSILLMREATSVPQSAQPPALLQQAITAGYPQAPQQSLAAAPGGNLPPSAKLQEMRARHLYEALKRS